MTDETLMWLLPVVFMLHDFEEIVMMPFWLNRHGDEVVARYPFSKRMVARVKGLSGSGYACAVGLIFILVVGVTLISVLAGWPGLWAAGVAMLGLHFLWHIGQVLVWRGYVPVIETSVLGLIWCIWTLTEALDRGMVRQGDIWAWIPFAFVVTLAWQSLAHRAAHVVDAWLRRRFGTPGSSV